MLPETEKRILTWMHEQDRKEGRLEHHPSKSIQEALSLDEFECQSALRALDGIYITTLKGDGGIGRARLAAEGERIARSWQR